MTVGKMPGDEAEFHDTLFLAFQDGRPPTEDEVRLAGRKFASLVERDEAKPQDFTEAVAWFDRAAGLGSVGSQATLGQSHEFGYGVGPRSDRR